MHAYISYLLADLAAVHQPERKVVWNIAVQNPTLSDVVAEFEGICQEPGYTLGYYSGLGAKGFPPADHLNNKEMLKVCKVFKKMMHS